MSRTELDMSSASSQPVAPYGKTFFRSMSVGSGQSAVEIVPLLLDLISPNSVVDVGCGVGAWLAVLEQHGLSDYIGVDGSYITRNILEIDPDKFVVHDLKQPFQLDREFDMVMSLEVAEHIPATHAASFVDSLVRLGPVVVFSAALPLQGGTYHVNEQWPSYWIDLFKQRGYIVVDCLRQRLWQNQRVQYWFAQNMMIFVREDRLGQYPRLQEAHAAIEFHGLPLVHPKLFLASADPRYAPAKRVLSAVPSIVTKLIIRRLKRLW